MYENEDYIVPIIWEGDGPNQSPHAGERDAMYNVMALPSSAINGDTFDLGGGTGVLGRYQAIYADLIGVSSPMEIGVIGNVTADGLLEITADVLMTETIAADEYRIIFLLTNHFTDSYNSTVIEYYEEPFSLTEAGATEQIVHEFEMINGANLADMRAVVLVQSIDTTGQFTVSGYAQYPFNMYPNLQAGLATFPMGAPDPIADTNMEFNGNLQYDLTDFFHFEGVPVAADIVVVSSNPAAVQPTLYGTILDLTSYDVGGNITISIIGSYNGTYSVSSFNVMIVSPFTEMPYVVDDSPDQQVYPNNSNPYSNSLEDLGWTQIDVAETNTLVTVRVELTWNSVDYPSEGSLHLTSPSGVDVTLYQSTDTGATPLDITVYEFMDENMAGTWDLYMIDSYGDGGHIVTDCTIYFGATAGTDADDGLTIPTVLNGNYPNPFNPTTTISYSLNSDSDVTLEIYNIKGQLVRTLVNNSVNAGPQEVLWNGHDDNRNIVTSGVYFYKLNAGEYTSTKKMILLK
jgi:type IX secretion system substrate protein/proprotein convertase P-domain-containing protein